MNLDGDYLQPREAGLAETIGRLQVELNRERAEVRRLRAAVEAVEKLTVIGDGYHHNHSPMVTEYDCALCWVSDIRAALAEHLGTGGES